ncbi:MAG: type I secretion system permease/ATPase [Alphaproteobacteria bacterium]|nr:type I secretion system permease/ATPase [Alphaproteobacteria bacterium]
MTEANNNNEDIGTEIDTGLACFAIVARYFEQAVDADQIRHKYDRITRKFDDVDLIRVAKECSLKVRLIKTSWDRLERTPLPAIAKDQNGEYFILAQAAEDKVLIQSPKAGKPQKLSKEELLNIWNGELILLASRQFLAGKDRRFDISWFIPSIVKYKRLFGEVILASFFLQIFALVSPLLFQVIIDKVLVHRGLTSLDVLIFALVSISVFEVTLEGLRTYMFSHTTTRIDVELGAKLFRHLIRLPLMYFGARRVGDTVARVRELENIRNFITGSGLTLLIDLFFTFVFFIVMFVYSKTLTYIVLASIPFYVVLSVFITPILRSRTDERFKRGAENQAFLVETVTGVETIKSLAVEPQMQRKWEEQLSGYTSASFRASHIGNIGRQGVQFIQKVTTALTLWFGAKLVMDGHLTVGQLVAFNMLAGRVSMPILRLAQLWQDFQQASISVEKLGDILNSKTEPTTNTSKGSMPMIKGDVNFDKVIFRYQIDGQEVLKNIDFNIKAGETIGFVGPSGSGKSTITKLIQRLYIPEKGKVTIDGIDLSTVDPAWLRRQIGVVLQEDYLFNRSVRDNIALADPGLPMDRIMHAAKLAGAHEFIVELADGYDSVIGERGSTLSGGQKQRIAIARALVTNPRILIFDEATSALDYESEHAIQQNMKSICDGRTVFMIAHRLSTVRDCTRIITIEQGEIVEQGTHKQLLKSNGRYAHLWKCQTAEDEVVVA